MAVEAKVKEDFGPVWDEWYLRPSPGKAKRWRFIASQLGIGDFIPRGIRYQFLHRLASAIVEARNFGARHAVLVVHAFGSGRELLDDYRHFLSVWGREAKVGQIVTLSDRSDVHLHAGWVRGSARFLRA